MWGSWKECHGCDGLVRFRTSRTSITEKDLRGVLWRMIVKICIWIVVIFGMITISIFFLSNLLLLVKNNDTTLLL